MSLINQRNSSQPRSLQQCPPLPSDPSGVYSSPTTDTDLVRSKKKFVKVSGMSEVEVEPDKIEFCIKISGTKSDLKECRASIKKREDYIFAVMKRNGINPKNIQSNEMVSKRTELETMQDEEEEEHVGVRNILEKSVNANVNNNNNDNARNIVDQRDPRPPPIPLSSKCILYTVVKELCVKCENISKYRQILSICNEKLDFRVVVSEPIISFTSQIMEKSTQMALQMAVNNAQAKANNLIIGKNTTTKNGSLGPIIYIIEESLSIDNLTEFGDSPFESLKWRQHSKRIKVQITSVNEILTEANKNRQIAI